MPQSFERPWSQLSGLEQADLAANPSGPVPKYLIPRLLELGVIGRNGMYVIGARMRGTPTGTDYYVSAKFAQFISSRP